MGNVILDQFGIGPMGNFSYFIGDKETKEVAVVDAAWDTGLIKQKAQDSGYKIVAVLLTHGHPDHVNAVDELVEDLDIPVYVSEKEIRMISPKDKHVKLVSDREKIKIGNIEVVCLLTPGHTPGSQCFKCGDILITGDAMFIDGCGRCDLPGGDAATMYNTLYNIISTLPDETIIYPGHDYGAKSSATLSEQKKTNPYLQAKDLEDFLCQRMG